MIQVPEKYQVQKNKKQVRVGKPPKGSRAHRSKLGSWGTNKIYYIGIIPIQQVKTKTKNEEEANPSTLRAVLMGTKSCAKILVFSTRFSCENLPVNRRLRWKTYTPGPSS